MRLQLQQQLSGVRTPPKRSAPDVRSCSSKEALPCRSANEYVAAIVELGDLVIDRRFRILHHWDWIYWKTAQGKRFKRALSVVHGYTGQTKTFFFSTLV